MQRIKAKIWVEDKGLPSALQFVNFAVHFCVEFDGPAVGFGLSDYTKDSDVLVIDFFGA